MKAVNFLLKNLALNCWALSFLLAPLIPAHADSLDTWTAVTAAPTNGYYGDQLMAITYANGHYVAVGQFNNMDGGFTSTSADGYTWTIPTYAQNPVWNLYDVAYGNGVFVATGWEWYSGVNIYHSLDGLTWTPHQSTSGNVRAVTYGGGKFVAVGDGQLSTGSTNRNIYISSDGINWSSRPSGVPAVQDFQGVAYGNGTFAAIDASGNFYTSSTGSNWTLRGTFPTTGSANASISFAKDRFVALVDSIFGPLNMVSGNGQTWSNMPTDTASVFHHVYYQAPYFLALSTSGFFTSTNATNWVQRTLPIPSTNTYLTDLAIGQSNVVVVGYNVPTNFYYVIPVAYVSGPLPFVSLAIGPGPSPQLTISGWPGRTCSIQFVSDLLAGTNNWQTIATFPFTNSPIVWTDPDATHKQRFYRAVLLPP